LVAVPAASSEEPDRAVKHGRAVSGLIADVMRGSRPAGDHDEHEVLRLAADPLALRQFLEHDQCLEPMVTARRSLMALLPASRRTSHGTRPVARFSQSQRDGTSLMPERFVPTSDDHESSIPAGQLSAQVGAMRNKPHMTSQLLAGCCVVLFVVTGLGLLLIW
jgi:hypothetical protein